MEAANPAPRRWDLIRVETFQAPPLPASSEADLSAKIEEGPPT